MGTGQTDSSDKIKLVVCSAFHNYGYGARTASIGANVIVAPSAAGQGERRDTLEMLGEAIALLVSVPRAEKPDGKVEFSLDDGTLFTISRDHGEGDVSFLKIKRTKTC